MAKNRGKNQRKLPKKPDITPTPSKITKKFNKKKINPKETFPTTTLTKHSSSDSEKLQQLFEPYTKDQLIEFIIDAALKDSSLFDQIRETADKDVSHRKIFVHGLGWDTTRDTLVSSFKQFGEIEECKVVTDRVTGKAKGYGFVSFKTRKAALKALKNPRKKISNRVASCQLASVGPVTPPTMTQDSWARKIYVSNVNPDVDPERLRSFFAKFGEIETGPLGFDVNTGKSRGFALFVYRTTEGAKKALEEPYKMFEGHQLHCKKAAEGKSVVVGGGAASLTANMVQPPSLVTPQNLTLFGQQQMGLSPLYGALLANPNAGLFAGGAVNPLLAGSLGQMGQVGFGSGALGFGSYGGLGMPGGFGGVSGNASMLGAYGGTAGTSSQMMQGLQHLYPNALVGPTSSDLAHGTGGSFGGYPSYLRGSASQLED